MRHVLFYLFALLNVLVVASCDTGPKASEIQGDPLACLSPGDPETELQVECRCLDAVDFCKQSIGLPPGSVIGGGPTVHALPAGRIYGGIITATGDDLLVGIGWTGTAKPHEGAIMRVNLGNGRKKLVSGQYQDLGKNRSVTGSGPELGTVHDLVKAPDGDLYALSEEPSANKVSLVAFDATTGNREVVWVSGDAAYGQCAAAVIQPWVLAMDASSSFILSADAPGDGSGLVRVARDGSTCEWVTRSGGSEAMVGGGVELFSGQYRDLVLSAGDFIAIYDAIPAVVRIKGSDGERTLLSAADDTYGPIGIGATGRGAIGERAIAWDWIREYYWTLGKQGDPTNLVAVSNKDGGRVAIGACSAGKEPSDSALACLAGPVSVGTTTADDGLWMHPDQRHLIMVQDGVSLVLYEPTTGNSNVFSY